MSNGIGSLGVVGLTQQHYEELLQDALAYRSIKTELDNLRKLRAATEALGVIGNGYCYCGKERDPDKMTHELECRDIRKGLGLL